MLAEQVGFQAVYLSGAGVSNSAGYPDQGLLTLTEFVQQARYVASAVSIPVICDADTGFGGDANVGRTVTEFEAAGAAAVQIEDQEWPKRCGHLEGKRVVAAETMVEKIRSAVASRTDLSFLIIARTDARSVAGLEDAVLRGTLYARAGADAIFPEALETQEEFAEFAQRVTPAFGGRAPILVANMTEFGKTPLISVTQFRRLGYQMILFPQTALRVALKAMREAFIILREKGSQEELLEKMMTRADLYALLDYKP
jgi:methylisocitrate lyase